jgi:hypothetical protein
MKLKAVLAALAVAGLTAAFGLTGTGLSDNGTTTTTTATTTSSEPGDHHCRGVEVAGTIASVSGNSLTVTVQHANKAGAALGSSVTFAVGPKTRVLWQGVGTLTGPNQGDQVGVRAEGSCAAGAAAASTSTLTAAVVVARAPRTDKGAKQGGDSHSKRR